LSSPDQLSVISLQPKTKLNDLKSNIDSIHKLSRDINNHFDVLCLPEYWNGIRKDEYSQPIFDRSISFLEELSSSLGCWIIGGSQLTEDQGKYYNRSHIFNPTGKLIGTYNKQQPFGYEKIQEVEPGKEDLIWKIDGFTIGIRICSDMWSTSAYSSLISNNELDIIFCPILTTLPESSYTNYGRFLWHNLAVIRAKEAASAIVVSDSAMQPIREPYWSAGASCAVDPSKKFKNREIIGSNLIYSIPDGREGIVSLVLKLDEIQDQRQYRKKMGLFPTI
jgi:predicted amidohydrolase